LHYYRNSGAFKALFRKDHLNKYRVSPQSPALKSSISPARSVLAWPAWLRVLAVLPAVALLWLAVAWANLEATPW